jgi:hypothetical protein
MNSANVDTIDSSGLRAHAITATSGLDRADDSQRYHGAGSAEIWPWLEGRVSGFATRRTGPREGLLDSGTIETVQRCYD